MTSPLNGLCQCGEDMDSYHGVKMCPHCDQACPVDSCPICRRYGYYVRVRVARQLGEERS